MAELCPRDEKRKTEEARKAKETTGPCWERAYEREINLQQLFDRVAKLEVSACACTCGKC